MEVFANVEHVLYSHGSQNNPLFVIICNYIDTSPFLVKDKDAEEQFKFDLQRQVFSK